MFKELKYFFFLLVIFSILFLSLKYYFSDNNKKNSYRSMSNIEIRIQDFSKKLILLASDTENITDYVKKNNDKNKKSFNFWKLININE
tara:strand:+ start:493 stop:756 length:264 start_codon:yes stop_codon:yes gene_type:complete